MILEVSHRVSDEGWVAKMFAGTTPSITMRKQEYEGEAWRGNEQLSVYELARSRLKLLSKRTIEIHKYFHER